jgi:CRP-like cAMP-binding protein
MPQKEIKDLIVAHPFFEGMVPDMIELIAGCGKNVVFREGEHLARRDTEADCFFAIRHGTVALELHVPPAGQVMIQTVREGEIVGWSWIFPPYRWTFDVHAVELVRAVRFDASCLKKKCDDDPATGYDIMKRFAVILGKQIDAIHLQLMDVYGKAPRH